jgi:hypothetical protein
MNWLAKLLSRIFLALLFAGSEGPLSHAAVPSLPVCSWPFESNGHGLTMHRHAGYERDLLGDAARYRALARDGGPRSLPFGSILQLHHLHCDGSPNRHHIRCRHYS